jgi:hypothetical protein
MSEAGLKFSKIEATKSCSSKDTNYAAAKKIASDLN